MEGTANKQSLLPNKGTFVASSLAVRRGGEGGRTNSIWLDH